MIGYWFNRLADKLDERASSLLNENTAEAFRALAIVLREVAKG